MPSCTSMRGVSCLPIYQYQHSRGQGYVSVGSVPELSRAGIVFGVWKTRTMGERNCQRGSSSGRAVTASATSVRSAASRIRASDALAASFAFATRAAPVMPNSASTVSAPETAPLPFIKSQDYHGRDRGQQTENREQSRGSERLHDPPRTAPAH